MGERLLLYEKWWVRGIHWFSFPTKQFKWEITIITAIYIFILIDSTIPKARQKTKTPCKTPGIVFSIMDSEARLV